MEQKCALPMIWLTWLGLPLLAVVVAWRVSARLGWAGGLAVGALVLLVGVVGQLVYLRHFPRLSRLLGYGSVDDVPVTVTGPAESAPRGAAVRRVTLYTASACPFCPIVSRRLAALQARYGFELREVDVTFQPAVVSEKGLRSVPVIECDGKFLVGNQTSAALAQFLRVGAPSTT